MQPARHQSADVAWSRPNLPGFQSLRESDEGEGHPHRPIFLTYMELTLKSAAILIKFTQDACMDESDPLFAIELCLAGRIYFFDHLHVMWWFWPTGKYLPISTYNCIVSPTG